MGNFNRSAMRPKPDPNQTPLPQMAPSTMMLTNMLLAGIAKKSGGSFSVTKEELEGVTPADLMTEWDEKGGLTLRYVPNRLRLEQELKELETKVEAHKAALAAQDEAEKAKQGVLEAASETEAIS